MLKSVDAPEIQPMADAVAVLSQSLRSGQLVTARMLERTVEAAFGVPSSAGVWDWRCAV